MCNLKLKKKYYPSSGEAKEISESDIRQPLYYLLLHLLFSKLYVCHLVYYMSKSSYAPDERNCRRKIYNPYQYYHLNDNGQNMF